MRVQHDLGRISVQEQEMETKGLDLILPPKQIPQLQTPFNAALSVLLRCALQKSEPPIHEFLSILSRRAKVDQPHLFGLTIPKEVGEIGVCLHHTKSK